MNPGRAWIRLPRPSVKARQGHSNALLPAGSRHRVPSTHANVSPARHGRTTPTSLRFLQRVGRVQVDDVDDMLPFVVRQSGQQNLFQIMAMLHEVLPGFPASNMWRQADPLAGGYGHNRAGSHRPPTETEDPSVLLDAGVAAAAEEQPDDREDDDEPQDRMHHESEYCCDCHDDERDQNVGEHEPFCARR